MFQLSHYAKYIIEKILEDSIDCEEGGVDGKSVDRRDTFSFWKFFKVVSAIIGFIRGATVTCLVARQVICNTNGG